MAGKTMMCLVGILFAVSLVSCEKLPESPSDVKKGMKMESLSIGNSIPMSWGNLVAVTSPAQFPKYVLLWFNDGQGNIYMIPYDIESNTFNQDYKHIKLK